MMVLEVLIVMRWRGIFNLFFLVIIKLLLYYIYIYIYMIHYIYCVYTDISVQMFTPTLEDKFYLLTCYSLLIAQFRGQTLNLEEISNVGYNT
jgi:hypothetical protein